MKVRNIAWVAALALPLWVGLALRSATVRAADAGAPPAAAMAAQPTSVAPAAGDAPADKAQPKGSDSKGKYWFKKTCKSCHAKGGEGGELTPMSKTIKQWERVFGKDVHHGDQKFSGNFDAEQLLHIRTFLINHAADSAQPETCG